MVLVVLFRGKQVRNLEMVEKVSVRKVYWLKNK